MAREPSMHGVPLNTLQHAATRCNTLQHAEGNYDILQHTATHCNILQDAGGHAPRLTMAREPLMRMVCLCGAGSGEM